ncbi:MAG: hypothetical protein Q7T18_03420, partial [Sedimentisphaerales bacterium]|nr:hypothetical protein [Sedimentisphaerales bacterium]
MKLHKVLPSLSLFSSLLMFASVSYAINPADPNLKLWLKASDLARTLTPGQTVSEWVDKSSYATSFRPRSGYTEAPSYQEVNVPGSLYPVPAVQFTVTGGDANDRQRLFQYNNLGSGDPLNIGNGTNLTVFVVFWPRYNDSTIGNQCILAKRGLNSSVYQLGIINDGTGRMNYITYDSPAIYYNNRSTAAQKWHITEMDVQENGTNDSVTWYDNATQYCGSRMVNTGSATISARNGSTTEAFGIGGHSQPCCGDYESFDGYIAEIIIYARLLNASEREDIEKYLNDKYFSPAAINAQDPSVRLWLKGDSLASGYKLGDKITGWTDSSSYGTTMAPGTTDEAPTYTELFIPDHNEVVPAVQFFSDANVPSGKRSRLFQTNNLTNDPLDIGNGKNLSAFVVWYPLYNGNPIGATQTMLSKRGNSSADYSLGIINNGSGQLQYVAFDGGNWSVKYSNRSTKAPAWHVTQMTVTEGGTNDTLNFYDDDAPAGTSTMTGIGSAADVAYRPASNTSKFALGAYDGSGGSNESFAGYIAEVIVYNRILGSSEKNAVESYLHKKYFAKSAVDTADSSLRLWLKADDLTHTKKVGDSVSTWTDCTAKKVSFAPSATPWGDTAPLYAEVYAPGNKYPVPALYFNGTTASLRQTDNLTPATDPTNIGNGTDMTAFIVYWPETTNSSQWQVLFGKRDGSIASQYDFGIVANDQGDPSKNLFFFTSATGSEYYNTRYNNRDTSEKKWHIT